MTYCHLWADCLYIRISSGPNARYQVWESLYLLPISRKDNDSTYMFESRPDRFFEYPESCKHNNGNRDLTISVYTQTRYDVSDVSTQNPTLSYTDCRQVGDIMTAKPGYLSNVY